MVIFKNLLEDSYDDFAYGIVLKDKRLFCLCGCNGTFEEDEYVIIKNDANPAKDTYLKVKSHKEKNDELLLKKIGTFLFGNGLYERGSFGLRLQKFIDECYKANNCETIIRFWGGCI